MPFTRQKSRAGTGFSVLHKIQAKDTLMNPPGIYGNIFKPVEPLSAGTGAGQIESVPETGKTFTSFYKQSFINGLPHLSHEVPTPLLSKSISGGIAALHESGKSDTAEKPAINAQKNNAHSDPHARY